MTLGWSKVEQTVLTCRLNAKIHRSLAMLNEERAQEHQSSIWDQADQVVLARIEPREASAPPVGPHSSEGQKRLIPQRWLKGAGKAAVITIDYRLGWCGSDPDWDAVSGRVGEELVVYMTRSDTSGATILDAIALGNLVERRVQAALPLHE